MALFDEVLLLGASFEVSKDFCHSMCVCVCVCASLCVYVCVCVFFLLLNQNVSSQLLLQHHACLLATMLPAMMVMYPLKL